MTTTFIIIFWIGFVVIAGLLFLQARSLRRQKNPILRRWYTIAWHHHYDATMTKIRQHSRPFARYLIYQMLAWYRRAIHALRMMVRRGIRALLRHYDSSHDSRPRSTLYDSMTREK